MTDQPSGSAPSERTRVRRGADVADYDRAAILSIIDATPICHVGVLGAAGPVVLPMAHGRIGEELFLHGATANALLGAGQDVDICVTFTELNGLMVARSPFHNTMDYRCAVVFGRPRRLQAEEKLAALRAITDHVAPLWEASRPPNDSELRRSLVLALPIEEASAKISTGDPSDEPEDLEGPWWAGTVPLHRSWGDPVPSTDLRNGIEVPEALAEWAR